MLRANEAVLLAQHVSQFGQRDVDLRVDGGQNDGAVGLDAMRPDIAAAGRAHVDPARRHALTHQIEVATATPNRSAASRRDMPVSTAAIRRERRSSDRDWEAMTPGSERITGPETLDHSLAFRLDHPRGRASDCLGTFRETHCAGLAMSPDASVSASISRNTR